MIEQDLNQHVSAAQQGSKAALEIVIGYAQGYVYNLALRMLQRPADAEDATQEILIRLVTHLGQFRGDSAFSTWMYRIACNYLLNARVRDREGQHLSFEAMSERLEASLAISSDSTESVYEDAVLVEEVKRSCTLGMLMCLNREERLAVILSDLVGVSSEEGADILGVSSAAYRKRLSRARQSLVGFVSRQCGLVNEASACRCHKHVANKVRAGLLNVQHLQYAQQPHDAASAIMTAQADNVELDVVARTRALLCSHPQYESPRDFIQMLDQVLNPVDPDEIG